MSESLKFAAIDIGTNAVRLLLARVFSGHPPTVFKKEALVRMPLRLGEDVFTAGRIGPEKRQGLIQTLIGFKHLMAAYRPLAYRACATSAMREANNSAEVLADLREASGIEVELIDGRREADIIFQARPHVGLSGDEVYLFVDVGGGSTELTLFADGRQVTAKSFEIGGIRMLKDGVPPKRWTAMKRWLREATRDPGPVVTVGSGGNINKLFRLARKKEGARLSYKGLRRLYSYLSSFTLEERITELGLRPDRADVIIPASEIYLSVMKWSRSRSMLVPMVGLSDGLIHMLYDQHLSAGGAPEANPPAPDQAPTPAVDSSI